MRGWRARVLFFVALLATWQALYSLHLWPQYLFPSSWSVASSLGLGFADGSFPLAILVSLRRILIGYLISLAVGVPLGLLIGRVKLLQETVGTVILGLQALPSICWLPLAILWFGLSERAILFVVIMGAVLSICLSSVDGVRNTPPLYLRAARTMGAEGWALYWRVILPAALPAILTGMKLGWSFAWRSLMAGELLYVSLGLGQLLTLGRELNDMSRVMAVMLVIVLLGLTVDRLLFAPAERLVRERWGLNPAS
jgi:NitT/TauT family transport system permease protein